MDLYLNEIYYILGHRLLARPGINDQIDSIKKIIFLKQKKNNISININDVFDMYLVIM